MATVSRKGNKGVITVTLYCLKRSLIPCYYTVCSVFSVATTNSLKAYGAEVIPIYSRAHLWRYARVLRVTRPMSEGGREIPHSAREALM